MKVFYQIILLVFVSFLATTNLSASDDKAYDPAKPAFHHISDANVYSIGPFSIPLPCILYAPDKGWDMFWSSDFGIMPPHGDGSHAVNGYVLVEGRVNRILDGQGFSDGVVNLMDGQSAAHDDHAGHNHGPDDGHGHAPEAEASDAHNVHLFQHDEDAEGHGYTYFNYQGKKIKLDKSSTADAGVFGGGITSFYDFSITKNVFSMLFVCGLMAWVFIGIARKYKRNEGKAPSGVQGFMETIFVFIQDEVAKPFLGKQWERFLPFLMCLFFFILGLNLWGQVPFFGGANVTGNLAVTAVLAIITFFVVNFNGNSHYWEHVFKMPGVPAWVLLILTPVEMLGVFIKPLTLMLRLFANITAGHMVVVIFVGLIFLFGESGNNVPASLGTAVGSTLLTLFMMSIELLVAFIQAFVFTILTASYIGAATEEAHHAEEAH